MAPDVHRAPEAPWRSGRPRSLFGVAPPPTTEDSWKGGVFEFRTPLSYSDGSEKKDPKAPPPAKRKDPDMEWIRETLDLEADAPWEVLRSAFRREIRKVHPDTRALLNSATEGSEGGDNDEKREWLYRRLVEEWKALQHQRKLQQGQILPEWDGLGDQPGYGPNSYDLDRSIYFDMPATVDWLQSDEEDEL
ncbi:unnamed protein product [Heterosigma akashiwo]